MISEFYLRPYFLKPKNKLNALDSYSDQPNSRQGLWLKPAKPEINQTIDKALKTNQTILKFLTTYFDYIYWPELGDTIQTNSDLKMNAFIEKNLLQEKLFIHQFVQPKIINSDHSLLVNTKSNYVINDLTSQLAVHSAADVSSVPLTTHSAVPSAFELEMKLALQLEMAQDQGFETIKFKISKNFETEIKTLLKQNLNNFEVRIDFNSCLEAKNITDASSTLKKIPNLEYLEDPCPFIEKDWGNLAKLFPLAFDNPKELASPDFKIQPFIQYYIIKPTRAINYDQILKLISSNKKITITNMMDSPLGTWRAYLFFSLLKNEFPKSLTVPGIHTHQLYDDSSFNEFLPFNKSLWTGSIIELNKFVTFLDKLPWEKNHD